MEELIKAIQKGSVSLFHEDKNEGWILGFSIASLFALYFLDLETAALVVVFSQVFSVVMLVTMLGNGEAIFVVLVDFLLVLCTIAFSLSGSSNLATACLVVLVLLSIGMSMAKYRYAGEKVREKILKEALLKTGYPLVTNQLAIDMRGVLEQAERMKEAQKAPIS